MRVVVDVTIQLFLTKSDKSLALVAAHAALYSALAVLALLRILKC